jgi:hypothetical protein
METKRKEINYKAEESKLFTTVRSAILSKQFQLLKLLLDK